jgi:hypothetical protein
MPISDKPSLIGKLSIKWIIWSGLWTRTIRYIYESKDVEEFGHTMGHICYALLERGESEHCVTQESKETGKPDMKNVPNRGPVL